MASKIVRQAAVCIAAWGALLGLVGCRNVPRTRVESQFAALPATSREQVQIYLVGSPLDGFELAGLPAMKARLHELGFANADHLTWTTPAGLVERVAADHRRNARGHIVLVGWSLGCLQVLEAAARLEGQQVEIDRVICLDGNPWIKLQSVRRKYPKLSEKVICIYPKHRDLPTGLAQTRQRQVGAWQHFGVPLHQDTIETVLTELAAVVQEDASSGPQLTRSSSPVELAPLAGPSDVPPAEPQVGPNLAPVQTAKPHRLPRFTTESLPARQITASATRAAASSGHTASPLY
ncbi:MAG: hypothetical protein JNG90_10755 [Planctomycetaceae bacterium]|nr:hypothetical protein [Planctomycetaceae bacterium]